VHGVLADKKYVLETDHQYLSFRLKDENGEVLPVEYKGVIPGNFDQATSIVAIGRYDNGTFAAEQLLVKCPSKYQAEADKGARHPEGVKKNGTS
jgi:cytochrome c-type biogenesis protein CcmE